jgi:outer membrane biosynthesis protein TonB
MHLFLIVGLPHWQWRQDLTQEQRPLEIFYQASVAKDKKSLAVAPDERPPLDQAFLKDNQTFLEALPKIPQRPFEMGKISMSKRPQELEDVQIRNAVEAVDSEMSGAVFQNDMETFKSPAYKSYYQVVREKIRQCAYSNYRKLYKGEVYLSFIISSEGSLREAVLNEAKSSSHDYLKTIALKSLNDAAPFPAFPKELKDKKDLSFHVIILFELK